MVAACAPSVSAEKAGPSETVPEPWEISPIDHHEVDAMAAFYASFEEEKRPASFWRERLRLWWHGNPAFQEGWHMGMKMTVGGSIVGALSAVPVRILEGGRPALGAALTTWRVGKDYRAGSIGMFEAVLQAHAGRPVFDSTPTSSVIRLLKHYGFQQPRTHFPAARKLCNAWRLIARAAGVRPVSLQSSRFFINERSADLDETANMVDVLWSRQHPQFSNVVVKDGAFFRWYCHAGRTNGRFGVITTDASGAPTGMAICLDMGNGVAWLVDMWCDFTTPAAASAVIKRARWHASRLGFHCLWVPHFHTAIASACKQNRVRQLPVNAFFKMPAPEAGVEAAYWTIAVGDFGF